MGRKSVSIKNNYLYNIAFQILNIIIPIITTPYVSRVLEPDGIGAYSFTFSIVTYFGMFGTLGISTYGQLRIAAERDNTKEMSRLFWELYFSRICTLIFISCIYLLYIFYTPSYKTLYLILIIQLIAQAVDVSWALQGLELFKTTVSRNFVIKIITTVLIFTVVKEKKDLYLYVALLQLGALFANLSMVPALRKELVKIDFSTIRIGRHWKNSIVYFIPTIATSVYTVLDKSMLGWIVGSDYENGYYEQAHKIEQILVTVVTSLGTVTLPRVSYLYKSNKFDEIRRISSVTLRFILLVSLPMCAGVIALANNLVVLFLGPGYEPCGILLQIFSLLIVIVGLDSTIGRQCLMPVGKQKLFNIAVICGAVVNLIMNLILIPIIKSLGAAIASVFAEITILILFLIFSKEYLNYIDLLKSFAKYGSFSAIMSVVVSIIGVYMHQNVFTIMIQIFSGILIYVVCLGVSQDELAMRIKASLFKKVRGN